MIIFNCAEDSVLAYTVEEVNEYLYDTVVHQWIISIWWSDGRESSLRLNKEEEMQAIQAKLERTVRQPPAGCGFTT